VKHSVKGKLEKVAFISITTDMWTGCHNHGYNFFSAHYVSDIWEMHSHCLQTFEIHSHIVQNLAKEEYASLTYVSFAYMLHIH